MLTRDLFAVANRLVALTYTLFQEIVRLTMRRPGFL